MICPACTGTGMETTDPEDASTCLDCNGSGVLDTSAPCARVTSAMKNPMTEEVTMNAQSKDWFDVRMIPRDGSDREMVVRVEGDTVTEARRAVDVPSDFYIDTVEVAHSRPTRDGKHRRMVVEAMERNGWQLASDGHGEYRSPSVWTVQVWTRDEDEVRVDFNREGYVSGYSSDAGYARIHGEGRNGRHGPWRPSFTPAMCRDLLIANADEDRLVR